MSKKEEKQSVQEEKTLERKIIERLADLGYLDTAAWWCPSAGDTFRELCQRGFIEDRPGCRNAISSGQYGYPARWLYELPNPHVEVLCPYRGFHDNKEFVYYVAHIGGSEYECSCGCRFLYLSETRWSVITGPAEKAPEPIGISKIVEVPRQWPRDYSLWERFLCWVGLHAFGEWKEPYNFSTWIFKECSRCHYREQHYG